MSCALPRGGERIERLSLQNFASLAKSFARSSIEAKPIFDFLRSRGARTSCPFCGHEQWQGWDERVLLEHAVGSEAVDRRTEAIPLTCANCGFIRFQSAPRPRRPACNDQKPHSANTVTGTAENGA